MQAQTLDPNSTSPKPDEDTAASYQLTEEQYYQQQLLAAPPLQTEQQLFFSFLRLNTNRNVNPNVL